MYEPTLKKKIIISVIILLLILGIGGATIYTFKDDTKEGSNNKDNTPNEVIKDNEEDNSTESNDTEIKDDVEDNSSNQPTQPTSKDENAPVVVPVNPSKLSFYQGKAEVNERFNVKNWLPGDKETKYYQVLVNHNQDVELYFDVDIIDETKNLSEILNIKITVVETGEIVFNGTMKQIEKNQEIYKLLQNNNNESIVELEIEVSLPTSAGNEYQGAMLNADFIWYVLNEEALVPPTGIRGNVTVWLTIMVVTGGLLVILMKKKGDASEN